jgi:hypothetical protein
VTQDRYSTDSPVRATAITSHNVASRKTVDCCREQKTYGNMKQPTANRGLWQQKTPPGETNRASNLRRLPPSPGIENRKNGPDPAQPCDPAQP